MFCRNCGTQVNSDAMFCHSCGSSLKENQPSSTPSTQEDKTPVAVQPAISSPEVKSSKFAIVGFVLSLVQVACLLNLLYIGLFRDAVASIVISIFATPIGATSLIFSIIGLNQTKNRKMTKRAYAIVGFVLSICILAFIFILFNISCAR